jgi:1-acyl-sn-glycerol-3-phosphate acyltransferase
MRIKKILQSLILQPFLWLLYAFFYVAARVTNWYFYRKIVFRGYAHFNVKNPFLLAPNHPNGIIDVLLVAAYVRHQLFFVANYGLFRHPIMRFLLQNLYCIPIKRREDVREGEQRDNQAAFAACDEHLTKGGNLLIAPEGTSWRERHIREIKTGTARIAFSAEVANNWQLGLQILPVGITYNEKGDFGTAILINLQKPLLIADFKNIYEQNENEAIKQLTATMTQFYQQNTIHCIDKDEDTFLKKIEYIFDTQIRTHTEGEYERGKILLQNIQMLKNDTQKWADLQTDVQKYFNILKHEKLKIPRLPLINSALFLVTLPIFLYGILNNGLLWLSCEGLKRKLKLHDSYHPTLVYLSGLVFFPIFLYLQTKIIGSFFQLPLWVYWLYFLSILASGKAAFWLLTEGGILLNRLRFERSKQREALENLANNVFKNF